MTSTCSPAATRSRVTRIGTSTASSNTYPHAAATRSATAASAQSHTTHGTGTGAGSTCCHGLPSTTGNTDADSHGGPAHPRTPRSTPPRPPPPTAAPRAACVCRVHPCIWSTSHSRCWADDSGAVLSAAAASTQDGRCGRVEQPGQAGHRRRREQVADTDLGAEEGTDTTDQPGRQQ